MIKCAQEKQNSIKAATETMNRVPNAEFITQWMSNNHFTQIKNDQLIPKPCVPEELVSRKRVSASPSIDAFSVKLMKTEPETSEPSTSPTQMMDTSIKEEMNSSNMFTPSDSNNNNGEARKNKRKSRKPQQLPPVDALNLSASTIIDVPVIHGDFDEKKNSESECGMSEQNQLSPAVSDSHTSGSGNDTMETKDDKVKIYKERLRSIESCTTKFVEAAIEVPPQISDLLSEIKGYCRLE